MIDLTTVAKALLYVGATVALGEVVLPGLPGERARGRRAWHLIAALALVTAPALWLVAQLHALDMPLASARALMVDSAWGRQWTPFAVSSVLVALALTGMLGTASRALLTLGAIALAITMGGLGHANADELRPLIARTIDAAHILAMGAWIGALILAVADGASTGHDRRKRTWRAMSRVATIAAPLAVVTGLLGAGRMLYTATMTQLVTSPYVGMLTAKALVVFAMLVLGALHRKRIARSELPTDATVRLELLLAAGVTVLTAVLTGSEPPG